LRAEEASGENATPPVVVEIEMPADLEEFRLPEGVQRRLQYLLDRQDEGKELTTAERQEAEGFVSLAEWLSLVKLRSRPISGQTSFRTGGRRYYKL
jgi:hypothetical protein